MGGFNPGVYGQILRVKKAWAFDFGGLLMRMYMFMGTIGIMSMLTYSGHSALVAGSVSSMLAITSFVVAPQASRLMDGYGQRRIIQVTSLITLIGIVLMMVAVAFKLPTPLLYVAALLMGFVPSMPAIARTRWSYLLETGKLGDDAPPLKSIYSYEGVLDDLSFMIGPSMAIVLAANIMPVAGVLFGGVCFAVGTIILLTSRDTEPTVGWDKQHAETPEPAEEIEGKKASSALRYPIVRFAFVLSLLLGMTYGAFDTTAITFTESIGNPNAASLGVVINSVVSMVVGFVYGMIVIKARPDKQLIVASICIGVSYGCMSLIFNELTFYLIGALGALFYAPFLITMNSFCEQAVPGSKLTEALTWVSSGSVCGVAIAPTISGALIDMIGPSAGFYFGTLAVVFIPLLALLFRGLLRRCVE